MAGLGAAKGGLNAARQVGAVEFGWGVGFVGVALEAAVGEAV